MEVMKTEHFIVLHLQRLLLKSQTNAAVYGSAEPAITFNTEYFTLSEISQYDHAFKWHCRLCVYARVRVRENMLFSQLWKGSVCNISKRSNGIIWNVKKKMQMYVFT